MALPIQVVLLSTEKDSTEKRECCLLKGEM